MWSRKYSEDPDAEKFAGSGQVLDPLCSPFVLPFCSPFRYACLPVHVALHCARYAAAEVPAAADGGRAHRQMNSGPADVLLVIAIVVGGILL